MKRISILFSSAFWIGTTLTSILAFDTSPVKAEPSCGSGASAYLGRIITPIASRQFNVACKEHDACYDTFGKPKQECDRAFHDRMRGICASDHNTIMGYPLKMACYKRAYQYYIAVSSFGGDAYRAAQASAHPHTGGSTGGGRHLEPNKDWMNP